MNCRIKLLLLFLTCSHELLYGQNKVAVTMDDIPNTGLFRSANYRSDLLDQINASDVPVAIFINEGLIYKTDSVARNFELLNDWVACKNTSLGNHSFSHSRYSAVDFESFQLDVEKGEYITRELARKYKKSLSYFRFPYNDLGLDAAQHKQMDSLLQTKGYQTAPFTVESSDWMFARIYQQYLNQSKDDEAKVIGELYVSTTLKYFDFFDSLAMEVYGRKVNQIYLCHDNQLNTDYLFEIISRLKEKGYQFITMDEAVQDAVYRQPDTYYKKWGVSWFYRWMTTQEEISQWMRAEPDMKIVEELYNNLD